MKKRETEHGRPLFVLGRKGLGRVKEVVRGKFAAQVQQSLSKSKSARFIRENFWLLQNFRGYLLDLCRLIAYNCRISGER